MRKKSKEDLQGRAEVEEKVLDVNAAMQGTLRFDDPVNLRISGKFEGTLDTKGKLMVGNKAEIKANITGEIIHIDGV
ncbi:MAG: polymer-forming cytoskeletal protein, partial [Candidatus Omnitrophica bacterium]|nr:polymer-forming cytoskeletal protein [Candidatus Omnitrophota bacterium]